MHHHLQSELVHHSLGRFLHSTHSRGYQPKTPPKACAEAQAQAQAQCSGSGSGSGGREQGRLTHQSPLKWKIIHLDALHIRVTEAHVESMVHIIFHPRTVDVVEKTWGAVPFQAGMISKVNIPLRLVSGKRLAGAFFAANGPVSTPFMLVHHLHHVRIVVNFTTIGIVVQWGLTSVTELHEGLQPFDR